ncbi:hypothetical protein BGW80DRAFT_1286820 [Lactifluus volemus]|nr:hypothetical protein BGW80DRAFT_1286820 [Lactifluus volemus]
MAANLEFALSVDPGNSWSAHVVTVGWTTIADEKEWNVFCGCRAIRSGVESPLCFVCDLELV